MNREKWGNPGNREEVLGGSVIAAGLYIDGKLRE